MEVRTSVGANNKMRGEYKKHIKVDENENEKNKKERGIRAEGLDRKKLNK